MKKQFRPSARSSILPAFDPAINDTGKIRGGTDPGAPNSPVRRAVAGLPLHGDFKGGVGGAVPLINPFTFTGNPGPDAGGGFNSAPDGNGYFHTGIAGTNAVIPRTFAPQDAAATELCFKFKEQ